LYLCGELDFTKGSVWQPLLNPLQSHTGSDFSRRWILPLKFDLSGWSMPLRLNMGFFDDES